MDRGRRLVVCGWIASGVGCGSPTTEAPLDGDATTADGEPDAVVTPPPAGSPDPSGFGDSVFDGGADPSNPFFASLGSNGRSCASCHVQAEGWSITPAGVQARFAASDGTDPVFRPLDGATRPDADVSTVEARQAAYAMLLSKGLVRVGLPMPEGAEFTLTAVDDPYGFASAAELSMFRRPLPSTNLGFLTSVMWDGREASLAAQAIAATLGHAQAGTVETSAIDAIVAFETSIHTAQSYDTLAGALDDGAGGGPVKLAAVDFTAGANDPLAAGFDREVFALYGAWAGPPSNGPPQTAEARRASIARGEVLFNTRQIAIRNVGGLNDVAGQQTITGTCSTCHSTPGAGSHPLPRLLDLGLAIPPRRTPDQPLYTFTRTSDGQVRQTTDPGAALITGQWADLSRFKVPVLRGLAMRAPYFHDGSAPTLQAVVGFYNARFQMGLTPRDVGDLAAFLSAL